MQKDKISMKKSILLVLAAIIVVILVGGQIFFTTNHLEYGSVYITSLKTLALREDFVGVRTSQGIEEGLYTLKETPRKACPPGRRFSVRPRSPSS